MHALGESDAVIANPLRASGLVDAQGLEQARAHQRDHGGLLSDALLRLNLIKEGDFLRIFAELYSTRFVKAEKLKTLQLDERLLERVGVRTSERLRMCPIRWDEANAEIHVVAAVPLASSLEPELRQLVGARRIAVYVATAGAVNALIRRSYYGEKTVFDDVTDNGAGPDLPQSTSDTGEELPPPEKTALVLAADLESPPVDDSRTGQHTPSPADTADLQRPGTLTAPGEREGKTVMVAVGGDVTIDTLRKENARYRVAQEFSRRVSLERSFEAMVDRILSVIFELTPAEGAAIWLTSGELTWKTRDPKKTLEVPKAVIEQTLTSPNGVLVNNAMVDQRFDKSQSVFLRGVQSVMAVPLRTGKGTLGVLYVESVSQSAAFSSEDLPLLDSIGAQAATLLDNAALIAQVKREVENRVQLSRFLSAAAVEEVLSGRMSLKMEGQAAEVTLLFADIRGFTAMSAQMPPEQVVKMLNAFFAEAVDAVERHHGIVDKFIGDCIMAMWGAPEARADDARSALLAAQEICERARRITVGGRPLQVGVGVTTGTAVVGAIGSKQRQDYTAIGSTVNLAARLCGIAENGQVLITAETVMRAGPGVTTEAGEAVILKGLDAPIVPYALRTISQPLQLSRPIQLDKLATQPGNQASPFAKPNGRR